MNNAPQPIEDYLKSKARPQPIDWFELYVRRPIRETHREHIIDPQRTPSRYQAAQRICAAVICARPVFLEGPAATGKTSLVEYLSRCLNKYLYRINNTKDTSVQDYFGSFMPNGEFLFGSLSRAMSEGSWFVADEFDLAEPAVMNVLYPILEGQPSMDIPNTNQRILIHREFRFFATQNGTNYLGRKQLPVTLRSRFLEVPFQPFTEQELAFIIVERNRTCSNEFNEDLQRFSSSLASTIMSLNRCVDEKQRFLFGGDRVQLTMREIIRWIRRKQSKPEVSWPRTGLTLLESRVSRSFREDFFRCLQDDSTLWKSLDGSVTVKVRDNTIALHDSTSSLISYSFVNMEFARESNLSAAPQTFLVPLWQILAAADRGEPVLLRGPMSCKSHLIRTWAKLNANESNLCTINCSSSTEANDLMGSIRFVSLLQSRSFSSLVPSSPRRPYTHAEALALFHNCVQQFRQRMKRLAENDRTAEHHQFIEDFEKKVSRLNRNIEQFVQRLKDQLNKSRPRRNETSQHVDEEYSPSMDTFSPSSSVDPNSRATSPPVSVPRRPLEFVKDDDDDDEFEFVGGAVRIIEESDSSSSDEDEHLFVRRSHREPNDQGQGTSSEFQLEPATLMFTPRNDSEDDEENLFVRSSSRRMNNDNNNDLTEIFKMASAKINRIGSQTGNGKNPLLDAVQPLNAPLDDMLAALNYSMNKFQQDNGLVLISCSCQSIVRELRQAINEQKSNTFLFQDGPVTTAVKLGQTLLLEDLNEPSQAVIDRLNSLLETEPSFILYEDFTSQRLSSSDKDDSPRCHIPILPSFRVFGTVHCDEQTFTRVQLSAATRSRMTEIRVEAYDLNELKALAKQSQSRTINEPGQKEEFDQMINILAEKLAVTLGRTMKTDCLNARDFLQFGKCVQLHLHSLPVRQAAALSVKFLFLDRMMTD